MDAKVERENCRSKAREDQIVGEENTSPLPSHVLSLGASESTDRIQIKKRKFVHMGIYKRSGSMMG